MEVAMPPVIVGVAAGVAAAGVVSTAAAIAIGVAATALTYAVTPEFGAGSFSNEAYAQQQMLRSPAEPRRGVYGRAMVSGPLIFAEETGTDNEFLHLVIALAGHRCDAIETVYFGDEVAWTVSGGIKSKFASHARIKPHLGDQNAADSQLLSDCSAWTSKHVGHGVTYLYVRLKYDVDVFPNGVPNIKALVRGKPVYDPRLDSSNGGSGTHRFNDPNTWQWTDNWALCVLDYTRFESGVGATETEIDLPTYALAAHDSDEFVEYQTDEWERRYSCNGTYTQDASPASILEKMLTAGAGMQVYVGGKYQLYAGVYQGPEVLTLTEDDCAGDVDISPYTSRSELCNAVRGTFVDPDSFYQPTDFTPYESAYYRGQDNGEYIDHDIDLPFTQSSWTAQRLAKLHLELNRAGMQITFPTKMIGLAVSVGKVIRLQLPSLGINQTFMVADWQFDFGRPVKLILRETNADIFEFDKGSYTQRDLAPNTTLPDPSKVPTVSGVVWVPSGDDANWQGELSWNAPGGNSAYRYRLEVVNQQQEVVYQASIEGTRHHVPKLDAGTYNLYLWAVNLFSTRSNIPASMTIGADAPPPVNGILADIGALSLTLRPHTAAVIAATTEFEVKGSLNTVLNNADYLGQGKEVLWPNRHPNTLYYVWARSVNNYGFGAWFGPVGIQTSTDNSAIVQLIGTAFDKFTWFAWADDNAGSGFTTVEAQGEGKDYLGVATEKKTSVPSGNWQDYTWTKIKTEIPDVFTPEEQTQLDNLMAGKLPAGDKDMLAAQDALNNPALANDLITSLALLNNGIDAASLNGETPAGAQSKANAAQSAAQADAQAKADAAKAQAIVAAASDATIKANNAKSQAEANAALDSLNKANNAIAAAASDTKSQIEKISIGGRNLLLKSKNWHSYTPYNAEPVVSGNTITTTQLSSTSIISLHNGDFLPQGQCTVSGFVKINGIVPSDGVFGTGPASSYGNNFKGYTLDPVTGYFTITQDYPGNSAWVFHKYTGVQIGDVISFTDLKLETGNKATAWTPAIEDIELDSQVKANNAQAAAESYAITQSNLAEITAKAYADGIVTSEEQRAISDAQNKADIAASSHNLIPNASFGKVGSNNVPVSFIIMGGNLSNCQLIAWWPVDGSDWALTQNGATGLIVQSGSNGIDHFYFDVATPPVSVTLGQRIGFSVYTGSHRAKNACFMYLYNSANEIIGNSLLDYNNEELSGGKTLDGYKRLVSYIDIPSGVAYVRGVIRKFDTKPMYNDSYLFYVRPQISVWGSTQTQPPKWVEGGAPLTPDLVGADPFGSSATAESNAVNTVSSGGFSATPGLVDALIASPTLFNQIKSRFGSFGGLTADTIAALAIATNHLQAGAVTADKLTVNSALIQKLIADQGLFNQLQAQLGVFGGLAANSIAAKAITTDKLDVRARNLVNNFTATEVSTGWTTYPLVDHNHNGNTVKAMQVVSNGNFIGYSDLFDIDNTKIYEVNFTIHRMSGGAVGVRYFGIAPDNGIVEYYDAETRSPGGDSTNFYFWYGSILDGHYRHMRAYIVGSEVDISMVPESLNVSAICKLKPGCKQVQLRALNYYNQGVNTEDRWINPSVTELGGGAISANQLIANSGLFEKLKAKIASFGGLTATEILADSALINKLVATSALFNSLQARLAVFGGLTANSISSDAILGRHIKAGETIESPVIIGGQYQLIGSNTMKIESETPFGPDGLIEWRGPKLILNGQPNWSLIRKSNATRWTDSVGNEYFGGSISAGILKTGVTNPDKNAYAANSYPVVIGPFGSGGKAKTVVVSFDFDASWTATTAANGATPALSWQLQRKIGSGSWATVSSGTFTGSINSTYEAEISRYLVNEFCSGSSTFTDTSTSTSDFSYQLKVISQTRYSATSNVNNQKLTAISTEQ